MRRDWAVTANPLGDLALGSCGAGLDADVRGFRPAIELALAVGLELGFGLALFLRLFRLGALGRRFLSFFFGLPLSFDFQPQPFGPRLRPLLLALLLASGAFAADRLQIGFEVVGAVVVIDLVARLDVLDGANENLALARANVAFCIRLAGVVDVAGDVLADRTVDGPAIGQLEQIFVLDRIVFFLLRIQQRPKIADDFGALLDPFGGEEAKSGSGTADAIGFLRRNIRHEDETTATLLKRGIAREDVLGRFHANVRPFAALTSAFPSLRTPTCGPL